MTEKNQLQYVTSAKSRFQHFVIFVYLSPVQPWFLPGPKPRAPGPLDVLPCFRCHRTNNTMPRRPWDVFVWAVAQTCGYMMCTWKYLKRILIHIIYVIKYVYDYRYRLCSLKRSKKYTTVYMYSTLIIFYECFLVVSSMLCLMVLRFGWIIAWLIVSKDLCTASYSARCFKAIPLRRMPCPAGLLVSQWCGDTKVDLVWLMLYTC